MIVCIIGCVYLASMISRFWYIFWIQRGYLGLGFLGLSVLLPGRVFVLFPWARLHTSPPVLQQQELAPETTPDEAATHPAVSTLNLPKNHPPHPGSLHEGGLSSGGKGRKTGRHWKKIVLEELRMNDLCVPMSKLCESHDGRPHKSCSARDFSKCNFARTYKCF